jgi:hypothetical protein
MKTRTHSHGPVAATRPDGSAMIAWLEDDPQATEIMELTGKPDWGAYVARIDAAGNVVAPATQVPLETSLGKGIVQGVALECVTGGVCRVALAWGAPQGVALLGSTIGASGATPAHPIWSYYGAPTQEVAPAIVGNGAFLCEDGLEKDDGRVRRLVIGW